MSYAVIYEATGTGYSAFVPALPGCVATGADMDEVRTNILDAVELHLQGIREDLSSNVVGSTVLGSVHVIVGGMTAPASFFPAGHSSVTGYAIITGNQESAVVTINVSNGDPLPNAC
jgi:predicted RNase H-like HicB family nuclease